MFFKVVPHRAFTLLAAVVFSLAGQSAVAAQKKATFIPHQVIVTYNGKPAGLKRAIKELPEFEKIPVRVSALFPREKAPLSHYLIVHAPVEVKSLGVSLSQIRRVASVQPNYQYSVSQNSIEKLVGETDTSSKSIAYIASKESPVVLRTGAIKNLHALRAGSRSGNSIQFTTAEAVTAIGTSRTPASKVIVGNVAPGDYVLRGFVGAVAASTGFSQTIRTESKTGQAVGGVSLVVMGGEYLTVPLDLSCVTGNGGTCVVSERMSKGMRVGLQTTSKWRFISGNIFITGQNNPQVVVVERVSPTPAFTPTPKGTESSIKTPTPRPTEPPNRTPTPNGTKSPSPTATPVKTNTPVPTATKQNTPSPTKTSVPTATPAVSPTQTPKATNTPGGGTDNNSKFLQFTGKITYPTGSPVVRALVMGRDPSTGKDINVGVTTFDGTYKGSAFTSAGAIVVRPLLPLGCTSTQPTARLVHENYQTAVDFVLICASQTPQPTISPTPQPTPGGSKRVVGNVFGPDGKGLANIALRMTSASGTVLGQAITGQSGAFTFPAVTGATKVTIQPMTGTKYFTPFSSVIDLTMPLAEFKILFTANPK